MGAQEWTLGSPWEKNRIDFMGVLWMGRDGNMRHLVCWRGRILKVMTGKGGHLGERQKPSTRIYKDDSN